MNYLWREIKVKKVINLISSLISKKKRKKNTKKDIIMSNWVFTVYSWYYYFAQFLSILASITISGHGNMAWFYFWVMPNGPLSQLAQISRPRQKVFVFRAAQAHMNQVKIIFKN